MKAGSFDLDTSKEVIGDDIMRQVELKARNDADSLSYSPPPLVDERDTSYWRSVTLQMRKTVYDAQYSKRIARNERKAING